MTTTVKKFYVYSLIDPRNGKVFYIGKGKGKRTKWHLWTALKGTHGNPKLANKIKKLHRLGMAYGVEFLFSSTSEQECFAKEIFYIAFHGRGNLCNLTDGGEGRSGYKHTPE